MHKGHERTQRSVRGEGLSAPSQAQSSADLASCRQIADSLQRLACFDAAVPASAAAIPTSAYATMDLVDWKVDKSRLSGRKVEVSGVIMAFGGEALLSSRPGDTSPVFVAVTGLPRDQQRKLFACSAFCKVRVRGSTGPVMSQDGIVTDALFFD